MRPDLRHNVSMDKNSHTPGSISILEGLLSDSEREYLSENPGMIGTLEREVIYVYNHWIWGSYPDAERRQMALDNYGGRLTAFLQGTLGLQD